MSTLSFKSLVYLTICFSMFSCFDSKRNQKIHRPDNPTISYVGRIDFSDSTKPKLSGPGAYFTFSMRGTSCTILLQNQYEEPNHNYISVAIDGKYQGRFMIRKGENSYTIAENMKNSEHTILVCKATDSFIGYIELQGIQCKRLLPIKKLPEHKIEFIGNSITTGAEMDTTLFACDAGVWHDRHNAYLAYGPLVARSLNAQWVLSSISGMGLTRNWNDEGPGVPAFYDNLYLNPDSTKLWTTDYSPDLVTICLGTNDISPGDGSYDRQPLDSATFVNAYIRFTTHIHSRYPDATICLINGPVFGGTDRDRFKGYLEATVSAMKTSSPNEKVFAFTYANVYGKGCSGHPTVEEQEQMADELMPFLKEIMGWK
jgi:lysophospholipase L1-like esterase